MGEGLAKVGSGTFFLIDSELQPGSTQPAKRPIAVIGAGFSGTMATLHLLRTLPADQPVLLCERAASFGQGVAFATGEAEHLLNVRASNMSALGDEPAHFQAWLARQDSHALEEVHRTDCGDFASRGLYGRYLRSILEGAMRQTVGSTQLRLMPDSVVDVEPHPLCYTLRFASGKTLEVAGVVLANGNLPPEEDRDRRVCRNPWGRKALAPLDSDEPVIILGTGLTMVDLAISLRRRGFRGPILALSRGGLLPAAHAPVQPWPVPEFTAAERGSLSLLTARLRREIRRAEKAGRDWRSVIDSVRPITASLWRGLPLEARRRFLRHARRYWDIHRHRMAPPHAAQIAEMLRQGSLQVLAGRVRSIESGPDQVTLRYSPRGEPDRIETLSAQRVIVANGIEPVARTQDPLMRNLMDRGLVRLDPDGLGIEVTDSLAVVNRGGQPADRLWALGPIVRGMFWECVAVPDIREQAAEVAEEAAERFQQDAARWSFAI